MCISIMYLFFFSALVANNININKVECMVRYFETAETYSIFLN